MAFTAENLSHYNISGLVAMADLLAEIINASR